MTPLTGWTAISFNPFEEASKELIVRCTYLVIVSAFCISLNSVSGDTHERATATAPAGKAVTSQLQQPQADQAPRPVRTVDQENSEWIWKSPDPAATGSRAIRVTAGVDSTRKSWDSYLVTLFPDNKAALELTRNLGLASSIFDDPEPAGELIATLVPITPNDVVILERGIFAMRNSIPMIVLSPTQLLQYADGFRFFSTRNRSSTQLFTQLFLPRVYIAADRRSLLMDAPYLAVVETTNATTIQKKFEYSSLRRAPVDIEGTVSYPADEWTAVPGGYSIRGGGLAFGAEGISLLTGTQVMR